MLKENIKQHLISSIRSGMKDKGITLRYAASELGYHEGHLSRVLSGKCDLDILFDIAEYLGLEVEILVKYG